MASSVWEKLFISKVWTNYVVIPIDLFSDLCKPKFFNKFVSCFRHLQWWFSKSSRLLLGSEKTMKYIYIYIIIYISHGINFMVWVDYLFVAVIHISNGSWILVPDDFATTKNNQEVSLLWRFFTFHLWMFCGIRFSQAKCRQQSDSSQNNKRSLLPTITLMLTEHGNGKSTICIAISWERHRLSISKC